MRIPFGQGHLPRERVFRDAINPVVLQGSAIAYVREAIGWLPGHDRLADEVTRTEAGDQRKSERTWSRPWSPSPSFCWRTTTPTCANTCVALLSGRFTVLAASNGKQALVIATQEHPDLVLTDVMMPEMDGFALLAAIRENASAAHHPGDHAFRARRRGVAHRGPGRGRG